MKQLVDLQQMFQAYLLEQSSLFETKIQQKNLQDAQERLAIYSNAYVLRLIESLSKDFPGVLSLLGDDDFEEVARQYVQHYPSRFRSIRWFGQGFSTFLMQHEWYVEVPVVGEMAQFEWLLAELFDAADSCTIMTLDDLTAIPAGNWATMTFAFIAAWRQIDLRWNTVDLWRVHEEENSLEPTPLENTAVYLMWRHEYQIQFRPMSLIEQQAFEHCVNGGDMASLCELLCQWFKEEEVPIQAINFLKTWIQQGLILR
jgi:hypothetical protein